jgi:hypothetical protein
VHTPERVDRYCKIVCAEVMIRSVYVSLSVLRNMTFRYGVVIHVVDRLNVPRP